jgi:uncharacterized membrane protein
MGIFSLSVPPVLAAAAAAAAVAVIYRNARAAHWRRLEAPGAFSAWCFSIIVLPLLWQFDVPVMEGAGLHLLGLPIFVLMFGRQLAMTGMALSVIAYTAAFEHAWSGLGVNLLLLAVVPAYCGDAVMRATERFLPHHMFVYLLGNGFFGALAMLLLTGSLSLATHLALSGGDLMVGDTLAFMFLLAWGESALTGFLLTIFTVYRPEWVLTFDDDVYLRGK